VVTGRRAQVLGTARKPGLKAAVANVVEGLEARWFLTADGLRGSYFETAGNVNSAPPYDRNQVIYSIPKGNRIDPKIDFLGTDVDGNAGAAFNGAAGANQRIAGTGLTDDQYFTGRWEGTINIPGTGENQVTFFTRSDDGVRLWINGNLVINHWNDDRGVNAAPGDSSGAITLNGGDNVPVFLEFNQGVGGAAVGLYYQDTQVNFPRSSSRLPTSTAKLRGRRPSAG